MTYRPDIDGLRAVAVLAVLLFHLGFEDFSGGYVGVDVFFVISGYLITGIILSGLQGRTFDFANFYARRARRLLPAMFATIGVSSLAAIILFAPEPLESFAGSARDAALGVSNIRFWLQSDYFDLSARLKPLLHTWSLSVEWQFYALWPALIVASHRVSPRAVPVAVAAAGALSIAANLAFRDGPPPVLEATAFGDLFTDARSTLFYNMPFRVFEFSLGALVLWLPALRRGVLQEMLLAVGLLSIGYSVANYRANMLFDPLNPLLPCVGAALTLYAGKATVCGLLLRNAPAVYVGRISYSVYLVHWPLIVFTEYYQFSPLTRPQAVGLGILSLALGSAMFHLIEAPFRKGRAGIGRYATAALALALATSLTVPAAGVAREVIAREPGPAVAALQPEEMTTKVSKAAEGSIGCEEPCEFGNAGGPRVLIVGDSHVDHYTKALDTLAGSRIHFLLAYSPACFFGAKLSSVNPTLDDLTRRCEAARKTLDRWQAEATYSAVVLSQLWSGYQEQLVRDGKPVRFDSIEGLYEAMLQDIADRFRGFDGRIVVLDRAPNTNLSCYRRPVYLRSSCPEPPLAEHDAFRQAFDRFSKTTDLDMVLVEPVDTICPERHCRLADPEGHPFYTDINHLSVYGASELAPVIMQALGDGFGS